MRLSVTASNGREVDNIAVVLPHIKSGAVKPIAITSNARSPLLPDVPTIAQSALPDVEMSGWFALLVPDGTEPNVISKLNKALNETVNDPSFKRQLENMGAEAVTTGPEEADAFVNTEITKWREVIKNAGIATN